MNKTRVWTYDFKEEAGVPVEPNETDIRKDGPLPYCQCGNNYDCDY